MLGSELRKFGRLVAGARAPTKTISLERDNLSLLAVAVMLGVPSGKHRRTGAGKYLRKFLEPANSSSSLNELLSQ